MVSATQRNGLNVLPQNRNPQSNTRDNNLFFSSPLANISFRYNKSKIHHSRPCFHYLLCASFHFWSVVQLRTQNPSQPLVSHPFFVLLALGKQWRFVFSNKTSPNYWDALTQFCHSSLTNVLVALTEVRNGSGIFYGGWTVGVFGLGTFLGT